MATTTTTIPWTEAGPSKDVLPSFRNIHAQLFARQLVARSFEEIIAGLGQIQVSQGADFDDADWMRGHEKFKALYNHYESMLKNSSHGSILPPSTVEKALVPQIPQQPVIPPMPQQLAVSADVPSHNSALVPANPTVQLDSVSGKFPWTSLVGKHEYSWQTPSGKEKSITILVLETVKVKRSLAAKIAVAGLGALAAAGLGEMGGELLSGAAEEAINTATSNAEQKLEEMGEELSGAAEEAINTVSSTAVQRVGEKGGDMMSGAAEGAINIASSNAQQKTIMQTSAKAAAAKKEGSAAEDEDDDDSKPAALPKFRILVSMKPEPGCCGAAGWTWDFTASGIKEISSKAEPRFKATKIKVEVITYMMTYGYALKTLSSSWKELGVKRGLMSAKPDKEKKFEFLVPEAKGQEVENLLKDLKAMAAPYKKPSAKQMAADAALYVGTEGAKEAASNCNIM